MTNKKGLYQKLIACGIEDSLEGLRQIANMSPKELSNKCHLRMDTAQKIRHSASIFIISDSLEKLSRQ